MQAVFAPAMSILGQFRNQAKIPILLGCYLLPLILAFLLERSPYSQALVVALFAFAAYLYTAHHFWVKQAFGTLNAVMQGIGNGKLRVEAKSDHLGGQFLMAYERLVEAANNIEPIVHQFHSSATNVMQAANVISEGAAQLAKRTEEQAAALEETASTMEEFSATVKQNADNAKTASALATRTSAIADQGDAMVRNAIDAMARIDASAKHVADIIVVVEDIAFQTNLLALNAAVEAARAGEHGHGFAVVATEVRSLSQRSADAVKEIKALIAESTVSVEEGNKQVNATGALIQDIATHIREVAQHLGEITSGLNEQNAGVDSINRALLQIEDMTQQNGGLVQQTMTVAEALREVTSQVVSAVEIFLYGAEKRAATTRPTYPERQPAPVPPAPVPTRRARTPTKPAAARASRLRVVQPNAAQEMTESDWKDF
jgi:methyl-accepting chemotaxis protein